MNWDKIEGNWTEFKGKMRQKWGDLTDDDLDKLKGRRDEMFGKLQQSLGEQREVIEREVNTIASRL